MKLVNWGALTETVTWHELLAEAMEASTRVMAYIAVHPEPDHVIPGDVGEIMIGLGLAGNAFTWAHADLKRWRKLPPPPIVEIVLTVSRRARQVLPPPTSADPG